MLRACVTLCTTTAPRSTRSSIQARLIVSELSTRQFAAASGVPTVYHPAYSAPQLPDGHRFPMGVFRRIYDSLLEQGIVSPSQIHIPPELPSDEMLHLVHTPKYVSAFSEGRLDANACRRIGFGVCMADPNLIERTKSEVAGTLLTAELALQHGLAVNTAGGTHHAFPAYGSGFCILNDLAVTARVLLERGTVQRILILDLDVHQADGTAAIFEGESDSVYTLSVHAASNFPLNKQRSTLDIPLADGVGDDDYLRTVADTLPGVLSGFKPQLVLYDGGIDVHQKDALGRLALTDAGLMRREMQVLDTCLSAGIPTAGYMGGGYNNSMDFLVKCHVMLHQAAKQMWIDHEL
ncbi:hypothetical protein WJX73_006413 [Symbiochloris irregularis]|uniref:Histone deacetylase domain-containing protein n=1 Tax=Symbiochloris irregularis TaxID=706552 RepID=A0AAW1NR15_9CHLO